MERVFPKPLNGQKCRVLLTTHDSLVAHYINPSGASLLLQTLDKKNSMKLFLQTLFKCSKDQIPSEAALFEEMIEMAGEFLKLSGGLPLLIVLIGGLLSVKRKSVSVWVNLLEIFNQYERGFVFKDLITFCYDDLPGYLRSCFLYLRLFPEDTEIECNALIQLWVVEGFLKRRDSKTMVDVARDCLEEFIMRNLIEVTKRRSNGAPKTCRIHGLLRDFAKYESIEARFSRISKDNHLVLVESNRPLVVHPKSSELHGGKSSAIHFQPPKTFSLMNDIISFLEPFKFPNHVYSLICFSKNPQFLRFDQQFPLLRVLDLEGVENMVEVPYEIRNLILLRYLSLRGTRVKLIPSWIAKLHNLQTLDAPGSKIPIDTLKLNQLRHLFAYSFYFSGSSSSSSLPLLIDVLEHLQTLELDIGDLEISGLHELTNLKSPKVTSLWW
ncbi:toMV resistant protein Tm-2 netted virescent-like [Macadamia integrifolia]|uniref:toMV resistant protein Tm-2 netted virescent-like n=1 Tax=Macadamia integrifolia TaxID=60698 RepID=UPI001C4FC589|nr:toMV resistant protein Tm-2 netted virescent-like [Macadamia integrifolia]